MRYRDEETKGLGDGETKGLGDVGGNYELVITDYERKLEFLLSNSPNNQIRDRMTRHA